MAKKVVKDLVVISDSDDDANSSVITPVSPLTLLKSKNVKPVSAKRPIKRLSKRQPKNQTKLDRFFQTLTIKNERIKPSVSDVSFEDTSNAELTTRIDKCGNASYIATLTTSKPTKRAAMKGTSPLAKMASKESKAKPKITELKDDQLWKALVAQRRKPKSLTAQLEEIGEWESTPPSLDDFESKLITKQVVHSFPNDKKSSNAKCDDRKSLDVEEHISNNKQNIAEVIPNEPVLDGASPIFRPKDRIILKKRKDTENDVFSASVSGVLTSTPTKTGSQAANGSVDLFSDSSLALEEEATKTTALCDNYGRHVVVDCSAGDLNTVMLLRNVNGEDRTCELRGYWADTPVKAGDVVNIIGEFDSNGYICIDMEQDNMIVINPDFLVSGSVIASATTCVRRSVLGARYKGYESGNKYMLFGSILHEIFQKVLISEIRDQLEMKKLAESIAHTSAYAHDMYGIEMTEKSLMEGIDEYIPPMSRFLNSHVGAKANDKINITTVRDIEETVWSPRFGMKGKIDVTVGCRSNADTCTVPLELKTGRPSYSAEHKGQVTMYSMMLAEKEHGRAITSKLKPGLLVYLKDGSMQPVAHTSAAIKGLVNLRNELCYGLLRGISRGPPEAGFAVDPLPEPISQTRMCESCPHLITCSLHQRVFKDFEAPAGHVMQRLVPDTLSHLTEAHLEHFSKWSRLLLIESSMEAKWKGIRDLWTRTPKQRSACGTYLGNLTVTECVEQSAGRYCTALQRDAKLTAGKLTVGDLVVISEANTRVIIVTTASILEIKDSGVTLLVDRKLSRTLSYCIDKYDCYSGEGAAFTNLARLMENTADSERLRNIIIDGKRPEFDDFIDEDVEEEIDVITKSLNSCQKHAVTQALLAKDYLLIKGYPGTGKTSTIVSLVESLRVQGLSVLVTSYTNSAVDNILLKLKQKGIEFIRLGRSTRIHPDIAAHSSEYLTKDLKTVDEVTAFYRGFHVVGTTCLGISHPMLAKRRFDVCIVDEASQIQQPVSLGPLFYCSRFILVGDNQQLPPLIKSNDAKSLGMEQTLLDLLDKSGDETVELTKQYRMNEEIMRLSNQLIYNNKLECGSEEVRAGTLPTIEHAADMENTPHDGWSNNVTSAALPHSLIFLDTARCGSTPSKKTTIHSNTEATIVCHVCRSLLKAGMSAHSIGVITPYQAQVQLLRRMLNTSGIEINTVDQYQGRDKSAIVISFARTELPDGNGKNEGILSDLRRLNVAITRAKHKLVLIGNVDVLHSYVPVRRLLAVLRTDQIINLPDSAAVRRST